MTGDFPQTPLVPEFPVQIRGGGPQAITIGPRRPAPGENGFFFDETDGTIMAGEVERNEIEYDLDKVIVMCAVTHGSIETILYDHSQCFYFNEDAIAFGINYLKEKNSD